MRAVILAAALCVFIVGCERKQQPNAAAGIVVTDDAGRVVQLDKPATRIVSLMPTITDLVIAMGHADRLIARTDYDNDPRIGHLPSIGGGLTPSVEWIAARQPDLVISWPDNASRSLVSQINAVGIAVFSVRTDTIANTLAAIRNLGVLLGDAAGAGSLERSISGGLDSVRASVRGLRPVRAAYVLSLSPPTIAGPHTFIDELIRIAGGENVFAGIAQLYPEINVEELVRRDPDVIVLARESVRDAEQSLRSLPGWRDLRAVRNGHVHRVSPDYFNRSGPLMPRAARELAQFFSVAR